MDGEGLPRDGFETVSAAPGSWSDWPTVELTVQGVIVTTSNLFQPVSSISRLLCSQGRVRTRLVSNYVRDYVRFDVLIWGIVPHDDVICNF